MTSTLIITISFALGLLALHRMIAFAPSCNLLDHPGGRKDHLEVTPLVGGISIALVLLPSLVWLMPPYAIAMALAVALLIAIGATDDIREMAPLPKFIVQSLACLVMVFIGHIELKTVGNLLGFGDIGLWIFVVPMTVFAAIGVINSINMADGMDGHSGIIIFVALVSYAYVARESQLWDQYKTLLVLIGATAAFLALNLRTPWRTRAAVFLGDAGSMLMGFLLAWFAIDLSNGLGRTLSPISALWVVVIPLCDCVSLMLRRIKSGSSPLTADRQHLHHFLLARGFNVCQANWLTFVASLVCAAVGVGGWKFGIPQPALFAGFVMFYASYHLYMSRYFRRLGVANM